MRTWYLQGARFIIVGLTSNLVLYLLYLLLTCLGVGHKTAMTGVYLLGTVQTFILNRRWTFHHKGRISRSLVRYLSAYAVCYALNLAVLFVFVDRIGFPHAVIQGCAIVGIAVLLFVAQRFWVFPAAEWPGTGLVEHK